MGRAVEAGIVVAGPLKRSCPVRHAEAGHLLDVGAPLDSRKTLGNLHLHLHPAVARLVRLFRFHAHPSIGKCFCDAEPASPSGAIDPRRITKPEAGRGAER